VSCARLERTAGLDRQRVGRQNPEPPVRPALRRVPGVRARLILGAYSGPDGPASVAAGGGSPVTSEGSWPFRCCGITLEGATVEWTVKSNLYAQLQGSCTFG
jgi:hypothetical protein